MSEAHAPGQGGADCWCLQCLFKRMEEQAPLTPPNEAWFKRDGESASRRQRDIDALEDLRQRK